MAHYDLGDLGPGRPERIRLPLNVRTPWGSSFEMVEVDGIVWDFDAPALHEGDSLSVTQTLTIE